MYKYYTTVCVNIIQLYNVIYCGNGFRESCTVVMNFVVRPEDKHSVCINIIQLCVNIIQLFNLEMVSEEIALSLVSEERMYTAGYGTKV